MNEISKKLNLTNKDDQLKPFKSIVYESFVEFLKTSRELLIKESENKSNSIVNFDINDQYWVYIFRNPNETIYSWNI